MHKIGRLIVSFVTLFVIGSTDAEARGPYVTLRDDGTMAGHFDGMAVEEFLFNEYPNHGSPLPDIMSVWTSFPMDRDVIETLFGLLQNDVTGIGLGGTFESINPPLRGLLLHNDVTQLASRAEFQKVPIDGFARYLFLLELSHNWGPAVKVPGTKPNELIGSQAHWSFWMDATGSPAGGNDWMDNGDGTFTVVPHVLSELKYSMLDLYLMGLASASDVPPFGVLENPIPPSDIKDPFTGVAYGASSFPWYSTMPFTVQATRRNLTINDIIAANGTRSPAVGNSPTSFTLGIVLVVPSDATDTEVAAAQAIMDPVAESLGPAFRDATRGRGTMTVVTAPEPMDAGDPPSDGGADMTPSTASHGCAISSHSSGGAFPVLMIILWLVGMGRSWSFKRSTSR
jgi:hypothetical protein